jgi:NAD(P)-dependent dehydrogenase (short-subunit alcohol dehydrogenase family)
MRLKDKVVLVTGSASGIGEAMARRFAKEGAFVIVHGPPGSAAEHVAKEISEGGGRSAFVLGALEEKIAPQKMIEEVVGIAGRIDALVNNAGVMTRGNLESTDADLFDRTIAINLRAPLLLIRAALPIFRRLGGGKVLNIGSVNGFCGEKTQLAYSISKGGLMTLTRNLADAHGAEGIRVNSFNVGWTLTPNEYALKMSEGLPEDWPSRLPKSVAPSGRLLSPDDVAWAAVYFLSDEAPLINGAILDLEQYPMIGRNPPKEA